ncbi:hypothetical protein N657DRAFT_649034 [Parathielavia appendiculata]|uniref:Uncharacterized protein n=1 Tax=Parathielavia appendiculata TaxID=2587402 RepID=A0AAN6TUR2_9PEZI|nr:hypothetical protein N657DRAFT_649034 [Parathielavia appendiculata]
MEQSRRGCVGESSVQWFNGAGTDCWLFGALALRRCWGKGMVGSTPLPERATRNHGGGSQESEGKRRKHDGRHPTPTTVSGEQHQRTRHRERSGGDRVWGIRIMTYKSERDGDASPVERAARKFRRKVPGVASFQPAISARTISMPSTRAMH